MLKEKIPRLSHRSTLVTEPDIKEEYLFEHLQVSSNEDKIKLAKHLLQGDESEIKRTEDRSRFAFTYGREHWGFSYSVS